MGAGASTPVSNKAEPKNGGDTSNKAKGTILEDSPFDDISSNILGDDKMDGNQVASATKLKRMAFGQQTYMDQQRDYDQTLNKLDLNKTGVVDWIEPSTISPGKGSPAKAPTTPSSIKPGKFADASFHSPLDAKASSFTTPDGTKRPLNRKPPPPTRPNNVLPGIQNPTQQVIQAPTHTPVRAMHAPPPNIALPMSPQPGMHLDHTHSSHSASFSSHSQHRPMPGKHDHNSSGSHLLPQYGPGHHTNLLPAGAQAGGPPPGLISRPFPTQQLDHMQSDVDDGMIADFARSTKMENPKKPDFVPALSLSIALGGETPSRPQPRTAPQLNAGGTGVINKQAGLLAVSSPIPGAMMGQTQMQPPRQGLVGNTHSNSTNIGGAVGPGRGPNVSAHAASAPASTAPSPMVMAPSGRPGPGQLQQATPPSSAGAGPGGGKRTGPAPVPHGAGPMSAPVVKETKNVKRNRAQIPTQLKHALPTTGDWMNKRYIVNNYILLEVLGTGSYGEVRLCKDRTTDKLFAIKIFSKDFLKKKKAGRSDETFFEDIKREIAIMKKLLHPNVLRLFEVLDDPKVNKMYLVLEYMKMGDLINVLKSRGADATTNTVATPTASTDGIGSSSTAGTFTPLSDLEVWNIFRQVVSGIRYLHYQNVVHGDIKPQNLLLGEDGLVKIADFGISQMLSASGQKLADAAGTPAFMSPELCEGKSFSGQLADIWAIGATMFMLRFGHPPFLAKSIINLYNKICNDPLVFPGPIDPGLRNLLENLLEKDPTKRYTLQQIIMHPWFRHPPSVHSQFRAAATTPSTGGNGGATPQNGNGVNTNASSDNATADMSTTASAHTFKPPDSYEAEEEAAMKVHVKIEHNDELFMSIGGIQKREKKNSPTRDAKIDEEGKNESEANSENEAEEDMMNTDWGADVFQMIDDGDTSDKEGYDDDSVDESDEENDKSEKDHTGKSSNKSKFGSDNSMMNTRTEMTAEEGEKRAKRFQSKILKKSNENMLLTHDKIQNEIPSQDSSQASSVMSPLKKVNLSRTSPTALFGGEVSHEKSSLDPTSTSTSKIQRLPFKTISSSSKSTRLRDGSIRCSTVSRDEYDDLEVADELSMEDFSKIMDTLAMQPKKTYSNEDEEQHSINGGLLPIDGFSAELINKNNGIAASYNSQKGCRPTQEDRCVLLPNLNQIKDIETYQFNQNQLEILKQFSIGCIFDGHSGWRCAQYLTQHFVPNLIKHEKFLEKSCETSLLDTCVSIDAEVCDMLMDEEDSSGSTGVIMVYDGRRNVLTVAGVGDSMCVLSRSGKAVILNRMHRLDNEEERERVKRAGGTIINNRVNGLLAISRAFGDTQFKPERDDNINNTNNSSNSSSNQNTRSPDGLVISTPEIISEVITPKTEFAVMATDGLWDVMTPQVAVNYIRNMLHKHRDLEEAAKNLTKEAIERGSVDNVTVLIMSFHFSDEGKIKQSGKY